MNVNEYIGFMLYVIYYTTKLKKNSLITLTMYKIDSVKDILALLNKSLSFKCFRDLK